MVVVTEEVIQGCDATFQLQHQSANPIVTARSRLLAMDLLSKWKQRQPLSDAVELEMLGPELLASRHPGLSIDLGEGSRKSSRTRVRIMM